MEIPGGAESNGAVQETWDAFTRSRFDAASSLSDKDVRVQAMERELAALNSSLILARRLRNAGVSAACRLPAEVLTIVLLYVQDIWLPARQAVAKGTWNLTLGWMAVLQVCSMWREVAINTPVLWTNILCSALSTHYIPIFLLRSRGLPLSVTFEGYARELSATSLRFWFSPTILRRAKAIHYTEGPVIDSPNSWQEVFRHATPQLEILELSFHSHLNVVTIASDMFLATPDRPHVLKRLCLRNCGLPIGSPLLSAALTHLELTSTHPSATPSFRSSDLLALCNLQELKLRNVFPDIQETHQLIVLPHCFELLQARASMPIESSNACLNFIGYLRFPPTATACLDLFEPPEDTNTKALDVLKTFFDYDARSAVELLVEEDNLGILYGERPLDDWTQYPGEAGDLYAVDRIHGARQIFSMEPPVASILSCINLTHLKAVYLYDSSLKRALFESLVDTLRRAPVVHRLVLQSIWPCEALFHTLGHCYEPPRVNSSPSLLLCPQLEVVVIHSNGEDPPDDDDKDKPAAINCIVASLLDFLEERFKQGVPVRKLLVDEALKDWDVWKMVELPTVVTFFAYAPDAIWEPSLE